MILRKTVFPGLANIYLVGFLTLSTCHSMARMFIIEKIKIELYKVFGVT